MIEGSLLNLNEAERKPDSKGKFGDTVDDVKEGSASNKRKLGVLERVSGEGAKANTFVSQVMSPLAYTRDAYMTVGEMHTSSHRHAPAHGHTDRHMHRRPRAHLASP